MKKLSIYYGCHVIINIVLLFAFYSLIKIHVLSLLPIFLIALMSFQTILFKVDTKNNTAGDTAYSVGDTVRLTEEEQTLQYAYLKHSFLLCIPLELPLIFFLPSYWKLIGIIPYILAYIIGGIVFKVKNGKAIRDRTDREKKELEDQMRMEELGLK